MQERDAVLATVASVLHLGNISFQQGDTDNAELLDEKSEDAMYTVSHLMQVSQIIVLMHHMHREVYLACAKTAIDKGMLPGKRGAAGHKCRINASAMQLVDSVCVAAHAAPMSTLQHCFTAVCVASKVLAALLPPMNCWCCCQV